MSAAERHASAPERRLLAAARSGDLDHVERLLASEGLAILNETDKAGMNAVLHAALEGHADVLRFLLSKGGRTAQVVPVWDPYNKVMLDHDGASALHLAVQADELECVELLLEHGLDPMARDNEGHTAFSWARDLGYTRITKALVAHAGGDLVTAGRAADASASPGTRDVAAAARATASLASFEEWRELMVIVVAALLLWWVLFRPLLPKMSAGMDFLNFNVEL